MEQQSLSICVGHSSVTPVQKCEAIAGTNLPTRSRLVLRHRLKTSPSSSRKAPQISAALPRGKQVRTLEGFVVGFSAVSSAALLITTSIEHLPYPPHATLNH